MYINITGKSQTFPAKFPPQAVFLAPPMPDFIGTKTLNSCQVKPYENLPGLLTHAKSAENSSQNIFSNHRSADSSQMIQPRPQLQSNQFRLHRLLLRQ